MERSVCPQTDPETFYPEKGCSPRDAKTVCRGCPVILECRRYALDHNEPYGIWGGLTPPERKALKAAGVPADRAEEFFTAAVRRAS